MGCHLTTHQINIRKPNSTKHSQDVGKPEPLCNAIGKYKLVTIPENNSAELGMTQHSTLGWIIQISITHNHKETSASIFVVVKNWKQSKCPSLGEYIGKTQSKVHRLVSCSPQK